jgi:hypothetical protein
MLYFWPVGIVVIIAVLVWTLIPRRRANECPKCRYDQKGLKVGTPCPECGTPVVAIGDRLRA